MIKKVYLAGPMASIENHNYPAFHKAAKWLRESGYDVVSPAELHPEAEICASVAGDYKKYLPEDLQAIASCDGIVLLPGHSRSSGAIWELFAALLFDLKIYTLEMQGSYFNLSRSTLGNSWWKISAKAAANSHIQMPIVDVSDERLAQNAKWGQQNHSDEWWLAILGEEFGETSQAILHDRFGGKAAGTVRAELVQLAAVAMAWIECIDRRDSKVEG